MSERTYTMDQIRDAFARAHKIATGGRAHYMSIPPNFDRDADLILQSAIDELERRRAPSAIVAALEKERARWYADHLNDNPFDGGYTTGLTKAIDIVKELS